MLTTQLICTLPWVQSILLAQLYCVHFTEKETGCPVRSSLLVTELGNRVGKGRAQLPGSSPWQSPHTSPRVKALSQLLDTSHHLQGKHMERSTIHCSLFLRKQDFELLNLMCPGRQVTGSKGSGVK